MGHIYDYQVNYSHYVVLRQERLEQQRRAYENQQKQIQDTEAFIERFRYKATKVGAGAVAHQANWPKLERVEVDEVDTSHLNLKFPPAPRSGDYPVIAEGVGKSYGDHLVFADATFTIKRGEKVAFVGKNGEGKSNDGQVHHGRDTLHRYFEDRAQREDRLLCPEPSEPARRVAHRVRNHRPSGRGRYTPQDTRHLGRLHVWRRSVGQEGEGALGWRTHAAGHDTACCSNRSICLSSTSLPTTSTCAPKMC